MESGSIISSTFWLPSCCTQYNRSDFQITSLASFATIGQNENPHLLTRSSFMFTSGEWQILTLDVFLCALGLVVVRLGFPLYHFQGTRIHAWGKITNFPMLIVRCQKWERMSHETTLTIATTFTVQIWCRRKVTSAIHVYCLSKSIKIKEIIKYPFSTFLSQGKIHTNQREENPKKGTRRRTKQPPNQL